MQVFFCVRILLLFAQDSNYSSLDQVGSAKKRANLFTNFLKYPNQSDQVINYWLACGIFIQNLNKNIVKGLSKKANG